MTVDETRAATARVRAFFEGLGPSGVERLDAVYAPDASFRDPFNEVHRLPEIRRIFAQLFEHLDDCRFTFIDEAVDERGAFLTWDRTFRIRRLPQGKHAGSTARRISCSPRTGASPATTTIGTPPASSTRSCR